MTFSRKRAKRAHSTGSRQAWRKKLRFDPTEIYTEETRTNTGREMSSVCVVIEGRNLKMPRNGCGEN